MASQGVRIVAPGNLSTVPGGTGVANACTTAKFLSASVKYVSTMRRISSMEGTMTLASSRRTGRERFLRRGCETETFGGTFRERRCVSNMDSLYISRSAEAWLKGGVQYVAE